MAQSALPVEDYTTWNGEILFLPIPGVRFTSLNNPLLNFPIFFDQAEFHDLPGLIRDAAKMGCAVACHPGNPLRTANQRPFPPLPGAGFFD